MKTPASISSAAPIRRCITSAVCAALVALAGPVETARASLPLTETINTLPEGSVELLLREEFIDARAGVQYRRDNAWLGLGIVPDLSIWIGFQYVHRHAPGSERSELGDSFLKIWYYLADGFDDRFHIGLVGRFRFPTGRDAYAESDWHGAAFGNNELALGPVMQVDVWRLHVHLNLLYVLREGGDEEFYSGLSLNPAEERTFRTVFGLDYTSPDSFLARERLKNDYFIFSAAVNTNAFYPVIPYAELYHARRLTRGDLGPDAIPIEGSLVNPVLVSAGVRFFVLESLYLGIYGATSLGNERRHMRNAFGIEGSYQF